LNGRVCRFFVLWASVGVASSYAPSGRALDKQGSAHSGEVGGEDENAFDVEGALSLGSALYNPTYAARPDNTGIALLRYALHADIDLLGRKLSVPVDLNLFTDRERDGAQVLLPTEFDVIAGLTTTWDLARGASLELGSRLEHDRPVDRGGATQTYVDVRSRLLYSLEQVWPKLGESLGGGDVSGWFTLGLFAYNPTYYARPDNTGKAFFRYAPHVEVSILDDLLAAGVDATMFTDRETNIFRPSELDLTIEIIGQISSSELHLAYERDMPLDRGGLVQNWVYALFVRDFDLVHDKPKPLERRGVIPSP
jgi:hypothetical protein